MKRGEKSILKMKKKRIIKDRLQWVLEGLLDTKEGSLRGLKHPILNNSIDLYQEMNSSNIIEMIDSEAMVHEYELTKYDVFQMISRSTHINSMKREVN
jgi:uncharacterized phosphosugar-binding protein